MANQQTLIYDGYVKRMTAHNVEPRQIDGDEGWAFLKANGIEFNTPSTYTVRFFDGGRGARAWNLKDGRVVEYAPGAFGRALFAVFDKAMDHVNYSRPMGMFHYLYT
jgi:hypothetical protein